MMGGRSARYRQLLALCRRRGCPREDAAELVQEAHLRLFAYQRSITVRDVAAARSRRQRRPHAQWYPARILSGVLQGSFQLTVTTLNLL